MMHILNNRHTLRKWRTPRRAFAAAAAVPIVLSLTGCPPQTQAGQSRQYMSCQGSAAGQTAKIDLPMLLTTAAPASVKAGEDFSISVNLGSISVQNSVTVGSYGSQTLTGMTDLVFNIPVPANTSLRAASAAGGTSTDSYASVTNGVVSVDVAGPFLGGTTATLPIVTLQLTATGLAGSKVVPSFAGMTYADPSLTMAVNLTTSFGQATAQAACVPNPGAAFSSTDIVAT